MIIKLFKGKQPFLKPLIILALIFSAFYSTVSEGVIVFKPEESSPLYLFFADRIESLHGNLKLFLVFIMFFLIAVSLINTTRRIGIIKGRVGVPLLISVLCLTMMPQNIAIHQPLIAMLFFVPAITTLLASAKTQVSGQNIFNAGFLLSLASLIAFPLILFFPFFFIVLMIFRMYHWKVWVIMLFGLTLPWIYYYSVIWVFDLESGFDLWSHIGIYLSGILYFDSFVVATFNITDYILISLWGLLLLPALFVIYTGLDQQIIINRLLYRAILWLIFPAVIIFIIAGNFAVQYGLFFCYFITIILTTYLERIKKHRFVDIILYAIIVVTITNHFVRSMF